MWATQKIHFRDCKRDILDPFVLTILLKCISRGVNQKGVKHFTNFTGDTKQKCYHSLIWICGLISIIYNTHLYTHGDSTFASRKSSLRAFIWCINLHFTKNVTYALLVLTPQYDVEDCGARNPRLYNSRIKINIANFNSLIFYIIAKYQLFF